MSPFIEQFTVSQFKSEGSMTNKIRIGTMCQRRIASSRQTGLLQAAAALPAATLHLSTPLSALLAPTSTTSARTPDTRARDAGWRSRHEICSLYKKSFGGDFRQNQSVSRPTWKRERKSISCTFSVRRNSIHPPLAPSSVKSAKSSQAR